MVAGCIPIASTPSIYNDAALTEKVVTHDWSSVNCCFTSDINVAWLAGDAAPRCTALRCHCDVLRVRTGRRCYRWFVFFDLKAASLGPDVSFHPSFRMQFSFRHPSAGGHAESKGWSDHRLHCSSLFWPCTYAQIWFTSGGKVTGWLHRTQHHHNW